MFARGRDDVNAIVGARGGVGRDDGNGRDRSRVRGVLAMIGRMRVAGGLSTNTNHSSAQSYPKPTD